METETLVIGTLITLLCIIPFILAIKKNSKNKNFISQSLKILAETKNKMLSEIDTCRDIGISISSDNQYLFFIRLNESSAQTEIIEMSKFSKCEINQVKSNKSSELTIFQKIELKLIPKSTKENHISLLLYETMEYTQLNGELQLAEKWNKRINSLL